MKKFIKDFIKELLSDSGTVSSNRFIYVLGHIVILFLSTFLVLTSGVNAMNLSLISMLVGSLNGSKLIQKKMEK